MSKRGGDVNQVEKRRVVVKNVYMHICIRRTISATTLPMFIIRKTVQAHDFHHVSPIGALWPSPGCSWCGRPWVFVEKIRFVDSHQILLHVNMFYILLCTVVYIRIYIYIYRIYHLYIYLYYVCIYTFQSIQYQT